jgi:hypothetical protein
MSSEVQIIFSAGRQFYAVPEIHRECGLWLSVQKHPLPLGIEWHRPGLTFAAVMRGRDYYRIGACAPQHTDGSKAVAVDDELVSDYRDAAWWTPGLEEAWVEIRGLEDAFAQVRQVHLCETAKTGEFPVKKGLLGCEHG